jgi:hypothetical protein
MEMDARADPRPHGAENRGPIQRLVIHAGLSHSDLISIPSKSPIQPRLVERPSTLVVGPTCVVMDDPVERYDGIDDQD